MILTDTGPLIAFINKNDPNHDVIIATMKRLPAGPLITTWCCFTEAMYLLFQAGGYRAQESLWKLRITERLILHDLNLNETDRMSELMRKYHDIPMDSPLQKASSNKISPSQSKNE